MKREHVCQAHVVYLIDNVSITGVRQYWIRYWKTMNDENVLSKHKNKIPLRILKMNMLDKWSTERPWTLE